MGINLAAMQARRKDAKGFTLVELMVVVAIIGILAAIVTLNFAHAKSNSEVSATEANLKEIAAAMEVFFSDNQTYPLAAGPVNGGLLGAEYLSTTPSSPGPLGAGAGPTGNQYAYTPDNADNAYEVVDPAKYDTNSLANLPQGQAAAAALPPAPTVKCGLAGAGAGCNYVGYSNTVGIYGSPAP